MPEVWSAPVRFAECDPQGVVFNGHYLTWADEAVAAWWRSVGLPFAETGVEQLVKAAQLEWRSPARHGDTVSVDAELERLGRTSLTVALTVRVRERVSCRVRMTYVAVADGVAVPWPDQVRALLDR
ncbi:acyl-CoA thioesterase [Modestobacter roseus]|uniref:Acyl-CoA thioester hydrolase n=1 Tax=Modestobacter roseus TaxID=1181884 RepID=A0A562IY73_9ACTN|nr:thioesterase family protein [Modestobacter roseus]MQA33976.1 acyl-CoA thioesterase [Modestobacter roseus]TWH75524.1 acyl-CoA thioester hydrolase [Modestobacter roseus]